MTTPTNRLGRVSLWAVGLGCGAAMAALPGIASANTGAYDGGAAALAAADVADLAASVGAAAAAITPPTLPADFANYAISFSGITLYQSGTALAQSSFGNFAIAHGDGAAANAMNTGWFNYASADGDHSLASDGLSAGWFNSATATGYYAFAGTSSVYGAGSGNVATATGDLSSAYAGYTAAGIPGGSLNTATAEGAGTHAFAGDDGSSNNVASAIGDGSITYAPEPATGAAVDVDHLGDGAAFGGDFWTDLFHLF